MKAKDYIAKITKILDARNDVTWKTYALNYKRWTFPLLRMQSKNITSKDKVIMITAWIHGEEIAGPLSLLTYMNRIIDLIHHHGYKLIIYPLTNPSGFEFGTRLNIDNDAWSCGNNDFLRYKLSNGKIVDDLRKQETYTHRYRSSDPKFKQKLPVETQILHTLIKKDLLHHIIGHLDLHQDYITRVTWSYTYAYTFSDTYQPIITKIKKHIALLANRMIGAGEIGGARSNANGCIIRHDGTINDLLYRYGVHDTVAIETTGQTPLSLAKKINRLWISWLVLLLHHKNTCWPKQPSSYKKNEKKKK